MNITLVFISVLLAVVAAADYDECERPCVKLFAPVCVYDSEYYCLQQFSNLCYLDINECKHPLSKY